MPDAHVHLSQARRNEQLAARLLREGLNRDWAVIALFFAAMHYVDGRLFERAGGGQPAHSTELVRAVRGSWIRRFWNWIVRRRAGQFQPDRPLHLALARAARQLSDEHCERHFEELRLASNLCLYRDWGHKDFTRWNEGLTDEDLEKECLRRGHDWLTINLGTIKRRLGV